MSTLTGFERTQRMLQRKPADRICLFEHFWNDTQKEWTEQGHLKPGEDMGLHFGFDMAEHWAFNLMADLDWKPQVLEETDSTILIKDGNGAILRRHKLHDTTPEHVDFTVREKKHWDEIKQIGRAHV